MATAAEAVAIGEAPATPTGSDHTIKGEASERPPTRSPSNRSQSSRSNNSKTKSEAARIKLEYAQKEFELKKRHLALQEEAILAAQIERQKTRNEGRNGNVRRTETMCYK